VAVEQITAGQLIEPARNNEGKLAHPNGAS
jgi:hypothetical protein